MRRVSSVGGSEGDFLSFILRKLAEGTWDLIIGGGKAKVFSLKNLFPHAHTKEPGGFS